MFWCLLKIIIYDLWYHNYKYRSDTAGSYKKDCFISLTSRLVAWQGRGGLRKQQELKKSFYSKLWFGFQNCPWMLNFTSFIIPQEKNIYIIKLFELFASFVHISEGRWQYCTWYESLLKRGEDLGWQTCNPEPRQKHNKYNIIANLFAGIGHFLTPTDI